MFSRQVFFRNIRPWLLFATAILALSAGSPLNAAAEPVSPEFQGVLIESLTALWTGQEFSPELKQRQETVKTMLTSGAVSKAELESLLEASFLSIPNQHKTSRYILKDFPARVNALLSPHMTWEEVKPILWQAMSSPARKDNPIQIRIGTLGPPGTPWINVPETIAIPEIEKLSDGKVLIKIYGGGVMGEDTQVLRKMGAGQLDGCGCTALGVLEASPDMSSLLLPGLFKNYKEVDFICEKFRKRLDKAFEDKGYVLVAIIDTGYFYLFSKNKVAGLADLRKQKALTWFGAMENTFFQEMGITAMPVSVPDIVSALSTGQAETTMAPAAWMLGMQAYQYISFYLQPPLLYSPSAVFISKDLVDRVRKQIGVSEIYAFNVQEILVSEFIALEPEWNRQIRDYEEKSLKAFEGKCGMKAVTFSPEDQQAIEKAGKAVQQKLAGKVFPEDLMGDIQKSLEAYRAQH
ncbi:MAG: TRAP transporter substrate-binding protein DctP [Thermodesulfobacteriota bacterium]